MLRLPFATLAGTAALFFIANPVSARADENEVVCRTQLLEVHLLGGRALVTGAESPAPPTLVLYAISELQTPLLKLSNGEAWPGHYTVVTPSGGWNEEWFQDFVFHRGVMKYTLRVPDSDDGVVGASFIISINDSPAMSEDCVRVGHQI